MTGKGDNQGLEQGSVSQGFNERKDSGVYRTSDIPQSSEASSVAPASSSSQPASSGNRPSRGTPHASTFAPPTGVIFAGRSGLDFLELRLGVVRIPEVSRRIREAQNLLDQTEYERIDLFNAIVADDDAFNRNIKMKSLLAAIVQVGLYDRYRRTQKQPDVLIGNSNGDSALMVCVGQMRFEDLVCQSSALSTLKLLPQDPPPTTPLNQVGAAAPSGLGPNSSAASLASAFGSLPASTAHGAIPTLVGLPLPGASLPIANGSAFPSSEPSLGLPALSGMSLSEFKAFVRTEDGGLAENQAPSMDLKKLVGEVVEHNLALRFVNIGPAAALRPQDYDEAAVKYGVDEVTAMDSIELDPMLGWFWKEVRPLALAN